MKAVKTQAPVATNVRIPAHLREVLAAAAAKERRSLGNYLVTAALERIERSANG